MSKLDGKWDLTVKTYMGDMKSLMDFKVDGATLTGTGTDVSSGNAASVDNGKVDGDSFSYTITVVTPVGELTNSLAGTLNADDTLTGTSTNPMGEFEFEATRA